MRVGFTCPPHWPDGGQALTCQFWVCLGASRRRWPESVTSARPMASPTVAGHRPIARGPGCNKQTGQGKASPLSSLEQGRPSFPPRGCQSSCFPGLSTWTELTPVLQLSDGRSCQVSAPRVVWANSHHKSPHIYLDPLLVLFLSRTLTNTGRPQRGVHCSFSHKGTRHVSCSQPAVCLAKNRLVKG